MKWEYTSLIDPEDYLLEKAGKDKWELISVTQRDIPERLWHSPSGPREIVTFYFKRPMEEKNVVKRNYTKKELQAICNALNKIFWKVPMSVGNPDDEADNWVIELTDCHISLTWNAEKQEFECS